MIGGIVYSSNGTTALEGINVSVTNVTTGESHNGSDAGFESLLTNSAGEYSVNLGSYTNTYSDGDSISSSGFSSTQGSDTETTTVDIDAGGDSDVNLVLVPDEIKMIFDGITEIGERVDKRRFTTVYDDDTGTIENEDTFDDTTVTMSLQIVNDERRLMEWGEVKQGEAVGFFKGKDNILKGDLIRVPRTTGEWWRVQDRPVKFRKEGHNASWEARLVRVDET